jgi:dienelactone hydrolase
MRGLGRTDLPADDRTHLVRLTAAATGLSADDADRRVTTVLTSARDAASRARRSAVIIGFCLAGGLAAGAAAAWVAAGIGGRHRDSEFAPPLRFGQAFARRV